MLNISGYMFVYLKNLEHWQTECREQCTALALKGTVVWSPEGINIMLAGTPSAIQAWIDWLHAFPEFAELRFKFSESAHQPYGKMLVKIKQELVRGQVNPITEPAPAIKPTELKAWYEMGKDFVIIDTRNSYELEVGKFKNALDIHLDMFNEFPAKMAALPDEIKRKPVIVYCTGGIRCEKAAPLALKAGFQEVYQLEGGILNYFEECGRAFYEGDCFVFDERSALDENLGFWSRPLFDSGPVPPAT